MLDPSEDLNIGVVGGSVAVSADNDGLAEMFAAGALIIGTDNPGNPADIAISGDLSVTADNGGKAYLGYDSYSSYGGSASVTIGAIGGSVNVAATSGGDVKIYATGDLTIGDVTHDFSISASGSDSYAYVSSDSGNVSIGAVGGDFSVLAENGGDAELSAGGDLSIGDIGGSFLNQGLIDASSGTLAFGTVGGSFVNDGTIHAGALDFQSAANQVFETSDILTVDGAATSTNSIHLALEGGTATFDGSVESTFTFDFSPNTADTLALGDVPDFQGTIAGFGSGDAIDLASLTGVSIDVALGGYDDNGGSGMLDLTHRAPALSRFRLSVIIRQTASCWRTTTIAARTSRWPVHRSSRTMRCRARHADHPATAPQCRVL